MKRGYSTQKQEISNKKTRCQVPDEASSGGSPSVFFPKRGRWIQKRIIERVREEQLIELAHDFKICDISQKVLDGFFYEIGHNMLDRAVVLHNNTKLLNFIVSNISTDCVQDVLRRGNSKIIRDFFTQLQAFSQRPRYEQIDKPLRIKKLALLLKVDADGIKKFMLDNEDKDYMSRAQEEYAAAEQICESNSHQIRRPLP